MALALYAGTLTRYYAGDWDPAGPPAGSAPASPVDMLRAKARRAVAYDEDKTRAAVVEWRETLSQDLQARLSYPLDWDESPDALYAAGTPTWDAYSALLLWAAYAEHPELHLPDEADEDWTKDRAYQASNALGYKSRYGQLLYGPELWLPCDFAFTFRAASVKRIQMRIGSSVALLLQLQQLNQATWQADAAALQDWRQPPRPGPARGATLEPRARFAFAVFSSLAAFSVHYQVPLKLDY